MGTPRVSIVINNYNYGRFVGQAIESALAQQHASTEVVVVDDGSTDGSLDLIRRYAHRVNIVRKANGGQASAINAGFERCRGNAVIFLDADDLLLPCAAARLDAALARSDAVKAHWPLPVIDAGGRRTGKVRPAGRLAHGDLRAAALRQGPTNHLSAPMSGNGFKREFLRRVLPMNEPLFRQGADTFLFEVAPFLGPIERLEEPLGLYRLHGANFHGQMALKEKVRRQLAFYEHCCRWLRRHFARRGIEVDLGHWQRCCWWRRLALALDELEALPGAEPLIVADAGTWEVGEIGRRPRLPFTEQGGVYGGPPADDRHAIEDLERLRAAGARLVAFAWPAFWWLEHYAGLATHLECHYPCVLRNDRLIVFDLHEPGAAPRAADPYSSS